MSAFDLTGKGIANANKRFPSAKIKTADKIRPCFQHLSGFSSTKKRREGPKGWVS